MARILLTTASYSSRSLMANAQRCVNLYPEANPADSTAPATFYGTPGKLLFATAPGVGAIRGLFTASNGVLFVVQGFSVYTYLGGVFTLRTSMSTNSGPVYAADNGIDAVFVDGSAVGITVNITTFVAGTLSGTGWLGANFVDFLDGFFIFNKPNTQIFYLSKAYSTTIDALDFASAESIPDVIVRQIKDHNEIWLFGAKSIEVWSDSGDTFPLIRINGATMETGCASGYSVAKMDNTIYWLGSDGRGDGIVWRAAGYQPQRISTHALESEIGTYQTISDAFAYTYQQDGHMFYLLTFPTANKTWCFDAATLQWHERAYRDTGTGELIRDRASCYAFYGREHLIGDYQNGKIYKLDLDTYTDNGDVIERIKSFQHITSDNMRQYFTKFDLDMQAGVGNLDEPDPQVTLRWSDDGARTWSSTRTETMGRIGEYKVAPTFNRLGMGRDRVFEVSTTAKVKVALQGAFLTMNVGTV